MKGVAKHTSKTLIAGIVALLPLLGVVFGVLYLERELRDAWMGIEGLKGFYFPGLGMIAVVLILYLVGLLVSTFLGKLLWRGVDGLLTRLPLLGPLYNTLKQVLGYDVGEEAIFQRVVFVRDPDRDAEELGLVTNTRESDGRLLVFIPGSPMPTAGRLLLIPKSATRAVDLPVSDALAALVSLGKSDLDAMDAVE